MNENKKHLVLTRMETSDEGTFGKLRLGGLRLYSGELPWRDNRTSIICIPPGEYECEPYSSKAHSQCFLVKDVPGRTGILIHTANFVGSKPLFRCELEGCIAPGTGRCFLAGQDAVVSSSAAMAALKNELGEQPFILTIVDQTGGRAGGVLNE
ncbi:MAG: hypothetical protein KKE73_04975 [Proteobacteria bacterium]|nr:hypothetical protein [Pseudomonadota bacterium]